VSAERERERKHSIAFKHLRYSSRVFVQGFDEPNHQDKILFSYQHSNCKANMKKNLLQNLLPLLAVSSAFVPQKYNMPTRAPYSSRTSIMTLSASTLDRKESKNKSDGESKTSSSDESSSLRVKEKEMEVRKDTVQPILLL
jgi:hypothetical protein